MTSLGVDDGEPPSDKGAAGDGEPAVRWGEATRDGSVGGGDATRGGDLARKGDKARKGDRDLDGELARGLLAADAPESFAGGAPPLPYCFSRYSLYKGDRWKRRKESRCINNKISSSALWNTDRVIPPDDEGDLGCPSLASRSGSGQQER